MTDTNHVGEALMALEIAQVYADTDPMHPLAATQGPLGAAWAGIASAHATLALVEQQRIANLIALATGVDLTTGTGIARRASDTAHNALVSDPNGDLAPDIAAALGIGGRDE